MTTCSTICRSIWKERGIIIPWCLWNEKLFFLLIYYNSNPVAWTRKVLLKLVSLMQCVCKSSCSSIFSTACFVRGLPFNLQLAALHCCFTEAAYNAVSALYWQCFMLWLGCTLFLSHIYRSHYLLTLYNISTFSIELERRQNSKETSCMNICYNWEDCRVGYHASISSSPQKLERFFTFLHATQLWY